MSVELKVTVKRMGVAAWGLAHLVRVTNGRPQVIASTTVDWYPDLEDTIVNAAQLLADDWNKYRQEAPPIDTEPLFP